MVLKISGDNTVGSIGIKMASDCTFSARYIITFNATLAQNPINDIAISNNYNYVNNLHKSTETTRGHYGIGALSLVNQNALTLPSPYATAQEISAFYRNQADQSVIYNATSFYWSYEKTGNFSTTKYQEMLDNNVFEVVDGLPFMEKTSYSDNTVSYSIDQERAEKEGTIVKTIKLTITE
jgi:hypothetical protein